MRRNLGRIPDWGVGFAAWLIGASVFFRDQLFSRFDTITGDRGDARLIIFLHEHWWHTVHGDASWSSPPMFWPTRNSLGYSDTFGLNQVFYIPLRFLGFDQFIAFELTLISLTALGFASLFVLLRRYLKLGLIPTCLLALTATFANNLYIDSGHSQMYAINHVSLIVLLATIAVRANTSRRRNIAGGVTGLLLGLLLWSTFYIGWFTVLCGSVALMTVGALGLVVERHRLFDTLRELRRVIAIAVTGFAVGLIPFAVTYLPVLGNSQPRTYAEVASYAPRPLDLINVGRHNVVWGWLVRTLLNHNERLDILSKAAAPTPLLLITVGAAAVWSVHRRPITTSGLLCIGASVTTAFAVLLPIQFGFGGAWAWTSRFVPGGSAIRVYARIGVLATLIGCLAIALWLHARSGTALRGRGRMMTIAPLLVLALIAVEQINTTDGYRRLDRSNEINFLAGTPPPPDACTSFYVTDATREPTVYSSITALQIADRFGIPTLNGYSGQLPPDWNIWPWIDGYETVVAEWVRAESVDAPVCALELTTRTWTQPPAP